MKVNFQSLKSFYEFKLDLTILNPDNFPFPAKQFIKLQAIKQCNPDNALATFESNDLKI